MFSRAARSFVVLSLLLLAAPVGGFAEDEAAMKLAYRMQAAVLERQDLEEIRAILKAGFDVNAPIGCGTFNSVDGAVTRGNVEMLELLLKAGANPKSLVDAAFHVNPFTACAMTKALLKAGADPNHKDHYMDDPVPSRTPLHAAAYRGHLEVVELLLQQPGLELNVLNRDGRTPLMSAVAQGHDKVIRALLQKGADPTVKNTKGQSAVEVAQEEIRKREAILQMLVAPARPPAKAAAGLTSVERP